MAVSSGFGTFVDGTRHFQAAAIADLLPTQMTVGLREVRIKRERWRQKAPEKAAHYLTTHSVPSS